MPRLSMHWRRLESSHVSAASPYRREIDEFPRFASLLVDLFVCSVGLQALAFAEEGNEDHCLWRAGDSKLTRLGKLDFSTVRRTFCRRC